MTEQKNTVPTEDGEIIQCPKCLLVLSSSRDVFPFCGEKQIPFKAQPYESSRIREAREDQISDEIIEMLKDRNLSASAAKGVLTKTGSKVIVLQEELDKAYQDSSLYYRSKVKNVNLEQRVAQLEKEMADLKRQLEERPELDSVI